MNEPMSDSYKNVIDEFKLWSAKWSKRISDFKSGVSPFPRHETTYKPY